ncbi:MAG: ACP phosphodiesterase [Cryomorphaceae bacterium]|jgi:acyl carrier protein phosphodiesterase|nr:ACP phosphodiesterase [Cryomorphaceae bacterium]
MNLLGHLYFSANDHELMYANLFGDSVKGSQYNQFPPKIVEGIALHRRIDHFIDSHESTVSLKRQLYERLPKVAPIAIDLFYDHLLAKEWNLYSKIPYTEFLEKFYSYSPALWAYYPEDFKTFIQRMRIHKWINHYPSFYGLERLCEGVSSRLSFESRLKNAPEVFLEKELLITKTFKEFMTAATNEFLH